MASAVPFSVCSKLWTAALFTVTDGEATGLVVGGVGGTGDLAELAGFPAARHPGFEVVLAVSGAAEVAGADVHDPVRQAEALEDLVPLSQPSLRELSAGLLGCGEGEHLDLRELVDPVEAAARPSVGAGLGTETVGEPGVAKRAAYSSSRISSAYVVRRV